MRHQNSITREVKKLVRHQNSITCEQNLITRQLLVARASSKFDHSRAKNTRVSSTIPLKSRRADVEASGLIVRWKEVDMLWVASSVKGRKVRIRAEVQLPNRYPVPLQVTMVQKQVTESFSHTILLH